MGLQGAQDTTRAGEGGERHGNETPRIDGQRRQPWPTGNEPGLLPVCWRSKAISLERGVCLCILCRAWCKPAEPVLCWGLVVPYGLDCLILQLLEIKREIMGLATQDAMDIERDRVEIDRYRPRTRRTRPKLVTQKISIRFRFMPTLLALCSTPLLATSSSTPQS